MSNYIKYNKRKNVGVDMLDMDSEYIGSSKIMTIDEAKKKAGLSGEDGDKFEKEVINKQDGLFKDIMSVVFGWKVQPDGSKKLVSRLPNGKILFLDRSERGKNIEPGVPYICLVYEREREAFAKVCSEEYQPKIFVPSHKMPVMVWRDKSGKTHRKVPVGDSYEIRMMAALKEMESLGFPSIRIIFRANQKSQ